MSYKTFGVPLLALVALSINASVVADTKYSISYTSEDFRSIEAVQALHARIRIVAKESCPSFFVTRDIADSRRCIVQVTDEIIQKVDHPLLQAYIEGEEQFELALQSRKNLKPQT